MKKLSVIIVSYNVEHFLNLCLQSVQKAIQNIDAAIIVVDNHSSDASCKMVKSNFPEVILIENKVNVGFSKANNQGVSLANGEYVLILNPDTVVAENTFDKMLSFADQQEKMGALGIKLINGRGEFQAGSKRNFPSINRVLSKFIKRSSSEMSYYANQIENDSISEVDVLVGAFMLLKKDVFQQVGGFDERYFMYGEDIDLSYQLQKIGFKNFYFGESVAIHFVGESTKKDIKYLQYFYGAMRLFYRKNMNINRMFDVFMSFGVKFWFWSKYFQLMFKNNKELNPNRIFYCGNNELTMNKLEKLYPASDYNLSQFKIQNESNFDEALHLELHNTSINAKCELILDAERLSFNSIIKTMEQLTRKGLTFKIKPLNAEYIIGSNFTIGKGEIARL